MVWLDHLTNQSVHIIEGYLSQHDTRTRLQNNHNKGRGKNNCAISVLQFYQRTLFTDMGFMRNTTLIRYCDVFRYPYCLNKIKMQAYLTKMSKKINVTDDCTVHLSFFLLDSLRFCCKATANAGVFSLIFVESAFSSEVIIAFLHYQVFHHVSPKPSREMLLCQMA